MEAEAKNRGGEEGVLSAVVTACTGGRLLERSEGVPRQVCPESNLSFVKHLAEDKDQEALLPGFHNIT